MAEVLMYLGLITEKKHGIRGILAEAHAINGSHPGGRTQELGLSNEFYNEVTTYIDTPGGP